MRRERANQQAIVALCTGFILPRFRSQVAFAGAWIDAGVQSALRDSGCAA